MPCEPSSSSSRPITRSIGTRGGSGSSPTWTWRPRLRRPATDAAHAASAPIASRLTWAPPPVSSRTSAPAATACSAPAARAASSAASDTSIATTRAPTAAAIITADSPTPPQPCTATHSPGCARPTWSTAR